MINHIANVLNPREAFYGGRTGMVTTLLKWMRFSIRKQKLSNRISKSSLKKPHKVN